jgi:hypothetical protein
MLEADIKGHKFMVLIDANIKIEPGKLLFWPGSNYPDRLIAIPMTLRFPRLISIDIKRVLRISGHILYLKICSII